MNMQPHFLITSIILVSTILLAACYTVSEVVPVTSGIEGQALLGPMCPVVQEDTPCPDEPLQAIVVVWDAERTESIGTFVADGLGHFRLALPPGDYLLEPEPPDPDKPFPAASPLEVTVMPDSWTTITIQYDTGIR